MKQGSRRTRTYIIIIVIISLLLLASAALNIFQLNGDTAPLDWLQSEEFVNDTVLGILKNCERFRDGSESGFSYDFENEEYPVLLETYGLAETAGEGSEFARALNLMHEYSGRIKHSSSVAVSKENMNARYLLAEYLDNKSAGTYCRAKAQILNEMCLALGIYARKLWITPLSALDDECHVVNEVWDTEYNKWVMLDISNNIYWADEKGEPLSVLEIRDRMINDGFCTPAAPGDDMSDPQKVREKYDYYYAYYAKNLAVLEYMDTYTVGETDGLYLLPVNCEAGDNIRLLSREAVEAPPVS